MQGVTKVFCVVGWDELEATFEMLLEELQASQEYELALAGEPGHSNIHEGWLLYKGCLCIITSAFRPAALHDAHDSLVGGHRGMTGTSEKLEQQFHWLHMKRGVRVMCNTTKLVKE